MLKGMGDGICTTPQCDSGAASVQEMNAVFVQLSDPQKSPFQSSVDAINSSFQSVYSWYDSWIPFNSDCCTVGNLGTQADALTAQMQSVLGAIPVGPGPSTQSTGLSVPALVVLGVVGFLVVSHVANRI